MCSKRVLSDYIFGSEEFKDVTPDEFYVYNYLHTQTDSWGLVKYDPYACSRVLHQKNKEEIIGIIDSLESKNVVTKHQQGLETYLHLPHYYHDQKFELFKEPEIRLTEDMVIKSKEVVKKTVKGQTNFNNIVSKIFPGRKDLLAKKDIKPSARKKKRSPKAAPKGKQSARNIKSPDSSSKSERGS